MQVYPAIWSTSAPGMDAPLNIFVRASDRRLLIGQYHAQIVAPSGVNGVKQCGGASSSIWEIGRMTQHVYRSASRRCKRRSRYRQSHVQSPLRHRLRLRSELALLIQGEPFRYLPPDKAGNQLRPKLAAPRQDRSCELLPGGKWTLRFRIDELVSLISNLWGF
jgi:hypothetical protein